MAENEQAGPSAARGRSEAAPDSTPEPMTPEQALAALRKEGLAGGQEPAAGPPSLVGLKLGQYRVLEKLGQGGMGAVFRAQDTALDRTVAIKVIHCGPLDDQKTAERFKREAMSLARLTHPNLLHVYNVGSEQDLHYFAMELLEGATLSSVLQARKQLPVEEFLPLAGQLLSALYYIHQHGITHRDIKGGNIMICGHRAVLMDFGLAKDEQFTGLTSIGVVLGTPEYMAPEQAEGLACGPPADLYSFGVVTFEALSGRVPFSGRSAMSIIRQHLDEPPPPIDRLLPQINPKLASIIHRCLAKKPESRYPDCAALAADLLQVVSTPELAQLASGSGARSSALGTKNDPFSPTLQAAVPGSRLTPDSGTQDTVVTAHGRALYAQPPGVSREASGQAKRKWKWWWLAAGGAALLLLIIALSSGGGSKEPPDGVQKPPPGKTAWKFQPVRVEGAAPGEPAEFRLVGFERKGKDPKTWHFVIARRHKDGTWKPETLNYEAFLKLTGKNKTLQFLPPAKPPEDREPEQK